jgi:hypothetical protein
VSHHRDHRRTALTVRDSDEQNACRRPPAPGHAIARTALRPIVARTTCWTLSTPVAHDLSASHSTLAVQDGPSVSSWANVLIAALQVRPLHGRHRAARRSEAPWRSPIVRTRRACSSYVRTRSCRATSDRSDTRVEADSAGRSPAAASSRSASPSRRSSPAINRLACPVISLRSAG